MKVRTRQSAQIVKVVERVLNSDVLGRGFGAPGEPGDEDAIRHAALRVVEVYGNLLAWSASVRGALVDDDARPVYDALVNYVTLPLEQIRDFVDELDSAVRPVVEAIREGKAPDEKVVIELTLTLSIDPAAEQAFTDALADLERRMELE